MRRSSRGLVADEPADVGGREVGHASGGGPGGQPAWFEHDDPPIAEPRLVEQGERDDRGLAGAGRRSDDGARAGGEHGAQLVEDLDDREVGEQGAQASAGDPRNGPGSPTTGMSGGRHAVASAMASATARHDRALQPSAADGTVPSTRTNTKAGSSVRPSALTAARSGIGEHEEPLDERAEEGAGVVVVGGDEEVDASVRAAQPLQDARRGRRIHELSLVYGSSATVARWNVVSHSPSGRGSPPSGVSTRSIGGFVATGSDGSKQRGTVPNTRSVP